MSNVKSILTLPVVTGFDPEEVDLLVGSGSPGVGDAGEFENLRLLVAVIGEECNYTKLTLSAHSVESVRNIVSRVRFRCLSGDSWLWFGDSTSRAARRLGGGFLN